MATTLTSTGITFSDATSQTTAVNDISDLNSNISNTELGYLNGVTSAIQTQLDAKAATSSLGNLATANTVSASTITDNSVGAAELNVSGNGTSGQLLTSDGDGSFSWADAAGGGASFLDVQIFNSSSTWNKPSGANQYDILVGGGSGAAGTSWNNPTQGYYSSVGGGGGSGASYVGTDNSTLTSSSYTVTVGSGGTVGTPYAIRNGNSGGASNFGSMVTANGGGGGNASNSENGAQGGSGGNGTTNLSSNQYTASVTASGGQGADPAQAGNLGTLDFAGRGGTGRRLFPYGFTYQSTGSRSAWHPTVGGVGSAQIGKNGGNYTNNGTSGTIWVISYI